MNRDEFWLEAKRRRNQVLFWMAAWLLVGSMAVAFFQAVLPEDKRSLAPTFTLVTWFGMFLYFRQRIVSMRCYRCGERAFSQMWVPLNVSRCKRCGVEAHET